MRSRRCDSAARWATAAVRVRIRTCILLSSWPEPAEQSSRSTTGPLSLFGWLFFNTLLATGQWDSELLEPVQAYSCRVEHEASASNATDAPSRQPREARRARSHANGGQRYTNDVPSVLPNSVPTDWPNCIRSARVSILGGRFWIKKPSSTRDFSSEFGRHRR